MSNSTLSLDTLRVRVLVPEIAALAHETDRSLKLKQQEQTLSISASSPSNKLQQRMSFAPGDAKVLHQEEELSVLKMGGREHPRDQKSQPGGTGDATAMEAIAGAEDEQERVESNGEPLSCCGDTDLVLAIKRGAAVASPDGGPPPTAPDGPADQVRPDPQSAVVPIAFPRIAIDRYGFLLTDKRYNKGVPEDDAAYRQRVWLENRRTRKWVKMIGKQLEDWEVCQLKNTTKLKQRIRKGIPEALRGRVWCHLASSTQMMHNNPGVYREFLQVKRVPCEETIARDIGRTFPKHYLFNDRSSMGQCALMNVLKAYSLHDPEVGYCQGMGFLTAMFLSYMPEEQSFWHLVACLNHKRYDMAGMYRPRMPKVPEVIFIFEQLLKQQMPQVARHMDNEGMHPTMYVTQWFITLFTYNFPFEFVTRVWDAFLNEGWKVIFRVALALMKLSQKALLATKFEGIMEFFRELPTKVSTEEVLSVAFSLPLKRTQLASLLEAYQQSISSTS